MGKVEGEKESEREEERRGSLETLSVLMEFATSERPMCERVFARGTSGNVRLSTTHVQNARRETRATQLNRPSSTGGGRITEQRLRADRRQAAGEEGYIVRHFCFTFTINPRTRKALSRGVKRYIRHGSRRDSRDAHPRFNSRRS